MQKQVIPESELLLTGEGKIYHLNLLPGDIGDIIYLVGDPGRVTQMSRLFDSIDQQISNREFHTHTGTYKGKRVSVLSTGIGTDNIEIVVNELDALANINLETRQIKDSHKPLTLIRIGTSGAVQADIVPGSTVLSKISGGLDNVMHFYKDAPAIFESHLGAAFAKHMDWDPDNSRPYFVSASEHLIRKMQKKNYYTEITLSAPGFYGPQGRRLRLKNRQEDYLERLAEFRYDDLRIANFEMEGSALYGLAKLLGHHALTVCSILANRQTGKFITDYRPLIDKLLQEILEVSTANE
ncbi:nucleoside phosphorylase [Bacteroidota bacterium]